MLTTTNRENSRFFFLIFHLLWNELPKHESVNRLAIYFLLFLLIESAGHSKREQVPSMSFISANSSDIIFPFFYRNDLNWLQAVAEFRRSIRLKRFVRINYSLHIFSCFDANAIIVKCVRKKYIWNVNLENNCFFLVAGTWHSYVDRRTHWPEKVTAMKKIK